MSCEHVMLGCSKCTAERDELRERLSTARDAIACALHRVAVDAEFAYHMFFTETFDRLVRALAAIDKCDPKEIRAEVLDAAKTLPQSRCAADREFIDGGGHV